jgi:lipoprotein-anchoring transpeptidase ErfK/SrfK
LTDRPARRPAHGAGNGAGVRPRYARLSAAGSALVITLVTLLGGIGVLPDGSSAAAAQSVSGQSVSGQSTSGRSSSGEQGSLASQTIPDTPAPSPTTSSESVTPDQTAADVSLPHDSGTGKRVVFDMTRQRIWLVDADQDVLRTYLVSGSLTDNLDTGTYEVYSRSRHAVGIDESGVMQYFVRFTRGENAAIGFHSIPTKNGEPLQATQQLGTPQSHGCIRQATVDARKLWEFAPVGTKVVVTA